jgi:hypothetical protein
MSSAQIVLYATSSAGTLKVRSDIGRIKILLDAKRVQYEEVRREHDRSVVQVLTAASEAL